MINLGAVKKIYFVGIGGIAMSAAAGIAREFGFQVTGSDGKEVYAPAKDVLNKYQIDFHIGYNQKNVKNSSADVYVFSAGEGLENPEVKYVKNHHLPHMGFPELLYQLAKDNLKIVVAGTHGKSTTTGLLGHVLKNLDDSSFMAGGVVKNYKSNFYKGAGHYFVFEGDEYKTEYDDPTPKFHYYKPDILILTNLEYDHPDLFTNFEDLKAEFQELIGNVPKDGLIIYNADDPNLTKLVHESNLASVSFAIDNEADFKIENASYEENFTTLEVHNKFSKNISSKLLGQTEQYKTQLFGKINVYNCLAAIATLRTLGFPQEQIALDVLSYLGIARRFEIIGEKRGITIIDDYAHHPTAVRETLEAARLKYRQRKIWAVFEPHTFSRTKVTLPELAKAFSAADEVLISEIYPAREKKTAASITSQEVVDLIKSKVSKPKSQVRLVHNKQEALNILKTEAKKGDVVIVMAVGDFNRLAYELKENL